MEIPDVVGFEVSEAVAEISDRGFSVEEIVVTKPAKAVEVFGSARVVRISTLDNKIKLVVAYQDYLKGGV